jgi:hypothetical protein
MEKKDLPSTNRGDMKFALVNEKRQEAEKGLIGQCQCCGNATVAKCGEVKIWHWAHKGKCDPWKEGETEWHRAWKRQFPEECQEVVQYAADGKKHIADVKIEQGYVIEFQFSSIKQEERKDREAFHRKMIWVVSGMRRKKDKDAFDEVWRWSAPLDGRKDLKRLQNFVSKSALLREWGDSSVPVFFDFHTEILLGVLPKTIKGRIHVCSIERQKLIASLYPTPKVNDFDTVIKGWNDWIEKEERYLYWLEKGSPNMRKMRLF